MGHTKQHLQKYKSGDGVDATSATGLAATKSPAYVQAMAEASEATRNVSQMLTGSKGKGNQRNRMVKSLDPQFTSRGGADDETATQWSTWGGAPRRVLPIALPASMQRTVPFAAHFFRATVSLPFLLEPLWVVGSGAGLAEHERLLPVLAFYSAVCVAYAGSSQVVWTLVSRDQVCNTRRLVAMLMHYAVALVGFAQPAAEACLLIHALGFLSLPLLDRFYVGQRLPAAVSRSRWLFSFTAVFGVLAALYAVPPILSALGRDMTDLLAEERRALEMARKVDERRQRVLSLNRE